MRKLLREHTKKTQGFSLAEVLMTVAILLILLALIVPAVFVLQKNLRQKELDSKAETIYMAVQERLTDLYSSGAIDTYNPATHTDITGIGTVPGDYDENVQSVVLDSDSVYALVSGRTSTNAIVNDEVLDSALKNGHFVVEYIPYVKSLEGNRQLTAATVYAVYYSEDREDVSASYYDGNTISDRYNSTLRDKKGRLKDGAKVGYYGGSNANSGSSTNSLGIVSAVITSNEEVNKAVIKVRKPITLNDNDIEYTFTLEDEYRHTKVITYNKDCEEINHNKYLVDDGVLGKYDVAFKKPGTAGVSRTFEITLDDLSSDETRFVNLFGEHSTLGKVSNNLVTGSNITLRVSAKSNDHTVSASDTVTVKGNSIFAYDEKNPVSDGTAYITTGRHLQNLDESSGVNITSAVTRSRKAITKAKIQKDISFGTDSKFYEAYKDSYFKEADKEGGPRVSVVTVKKINTDGSVTNVVVPLFKSITNSVLTEVSGDYKENGTTKNAVISKLITNNGLFQTVNLNQDITLKNFSLVGERTLNGANAGGVIGQVTGGNVTDGNVTLENIGVYLSTTQQDIPSAITQEMHIENNGWIKGNIAGGLVGVNNGNLNIRNSYSSTVLQANTIAGGLVGENTGSLTVNTSYSDSYIFATTGAGLAGTTSGTVKMDSVYAAGFLALKDHGTGAGLVNGTVSNLKNAYTLVKPCTSDDSGIVDKEPEGYTYYATVSSGSVSNVYYVRSSVNTDVNMGEAVNAKDLKDKDLGTQFQQTTLADHPYKLMGQSLTSYNYPKLNGLAHYGDWDAEFEEGSLVYYEQYSDGTNTYYGFDGANVHVSLVSKDTITGDGYGIVYEDNEANIPDSITVNVGSMEKIVNKLDPHYSVEANGKKYRIYPFSTDVLNTVSATSSFYTRVSISAKGETKYYDYNPLFAQSVVSVSDSNAQSALPEQVNIRSPRHLYNLSRVYVKDSVYKKNDSIVYAQLRNIDYAAYNWNDFTLTSSVSFQKPTGSDSTVSFSAVYDGGTNTIGNISFVSDGDYIGMFGYVEGTVRNVVLATQYREGQPSYYVQRNKTIDKNETVYAGILAGYNAGTIQNSAVAGYYLSGTENTIKGYANSKVYLGGFVGYNAEKGVISNCSADSPKMSVDMFQAECYAGGFTGYNEGSITNAYALTHITSSANSGKTIIAGFTAHNTGSISDTYCATALTSSGVGSVSYAYSPIGGSIKNSRYLTKGTYYLGYEVNSYDRNEAHSAGTPSSFADLQKGSKATSSFCHAKTTELDKSQSNYPFTAYVKKADGSYVHYGEWHVKPSLGKMGVFYWEKETSGNNNGYKISYIGIDVALQQVEQESTLCTAHDDGGVIEEYGYGYYTSEDLENVTVNYDSMKVGEVVNEEAQRSLQQQLSGFHFYPYTTKTDGNDYIYLEGTGTNGQITLTQTDTDNKQYSYTFTISPFFGNALSLDDAQDAKVSDKASAYTSKTVGWSALPYQIRSAQQLQYINWNYHSGRCTDQVDGNNYQNFNYLMYTTITGTGKQTKDSAGRKENANIVFKQSHDLNAETISNFQPVAGQNTSSSTTSYDATLYAWFGGTYDGQSYKIQELDITSDSFTVGLFGVTVDADIRNTILYSTKGAVIQRLDTDKNHVGGYSIGGLVGVAYDYTREENSSYTARAIRNCSIAGYTIIDNSANDMGLGEANVGGLTGVANINVDQCSSTANITINSTSYPAEWGAFIRVGGITGGLKDTITNCYSGGKITVGQETLDATYTGHGQKDTVWTRDSHVSVNDNLQATVRVSTHVYIAGIAGSGFTMNYKNFSNKTGTDDGRPNVENCYTYMEFPALEGTIRSISTIASVADRYAVATLKGITNCTYLDSSADIDVSKAPKYYFAGTNNNTMYNLANNVTQRKDMLLGNSTYVAKYFGSSAQGSVVDDKKNTSKTYTEMTNLSVSDPISFLNKMNGGTTTGTSKFHAVTSTESTSSGEQPINGKYSFNAGDSTLEGRNYPFPTVITQPTKENKTVNVHYGTWPNHDPYWSNGMDTLDIFSELNTAGEAVKTFTLNTNGKKFSLSSKDITFDTDGIVAVQGVMKVNDAYQVTLKALKTGTVAVTAHMKIDGQDVKAHFTLSVTANLTVTANPSELVLASKQDPQKVTLSMYPTADTTKVIDKDITWSVTSSHDILDQDVGFSEVSGNQMTITGFGVNGKVSVKGTVTYNGIPYSATTMIVVDRPAAVGLSDSSSYCEAGIVNDGSTEITGAVVDTYEGDTGKPENTSSRYFIYAANDKEILDGNIQVTATSVEANPGPSVVVDKSNVTTSSNGFTSIPVYITYRNSDLNTALTDVNVQAVITKDGKTYRLALESVTVKPTPYTVRLHGNGGIFTNLENVDDSNKQDEIKTVELMSNITLTDDMYNLKRTGYTFEGWYTDVTVSETKKDSVTFETQADLDLYALWKPKTAKIHVTVGEGNDVNVTYDQSHVHLDSHPGDGMYCTGWYQNDKQILDGDGNVVDQAAWNKAILNASAEDVYTLTPKYAPYKKVTLNLDGGTYSGTNDTFTVYAKDGVIDLNGYTPVKDGYTFIGWYTDLSDETTKVEGVVDSATYDGKTLSAKYTIGIIDFKVKKTDGSEETAGKTVYFTKVPETVNVEGFPEQYKKLDNNYLFEGWYIDTEEGNTVKSTRVLDAEGKVVNTNIFTVANTKTYALYAKWVRVTTTLATSFEDNSFYIFTNENIQEAANDGDSYGMTSTKNTESTLSGNNLKGSVSKVDNTSCVFTSLEALQSVEWAYTGGKLINQGKYLTAQITGSFWDGYMYSLQVSESTGSNIWYFTNSDGPIRIYSNNCYLEDSNNNFYATGSNGSVWAYKLNKEYKDTVE